MMYTIERNQLKNIYIFNKFVTKGLATLIITNVHIVNREGVRVSTNVKLW